MTLGLRARMGINQLLAAGGADVTPSGRTDNFTRADSSSSLGTPSDAGAAWTVAGGSTWGISSNAAYVSTYSGDAYAVLSSGITNAVVQVTVPTFPAGTTPGLIFRYQDASNFMLLHCDNSATTMAIYKRSGGSYGSALATNAAIAFSAGDVLKVTVDGSGNIACFQNGVSKVTLTDNSFSTQTSHGLRLGGASALTFDDFSIA